MFFCRDTERTEIVSSGFGQYPTYGYRPVRLRSGRIVYLRTYSYWNRPFYDDVWTRRYLEGTLTVDVIERDTGGLLYRAEVDNEVGDNLEKDVAKAVDRAFKKGRSRNSGVERSLIGGATVWRVSVDTPTLSMR